MKEDRLFTMVIVQSTRQRLGASSGHSAKGIRYWVFCLIWSPLNISLVKLLQLCLQKPDL